jgi:hypothetical protein
MTENNSPENQESRPAYYAVIPAAVRYDETLPMGAKLLYGEITALCNLKGFCWAGNAYFSKLYQKDGRTITRWIKALKDSGYINISFAFTPGSKEIDARIISLTKPPVPGPVREMPPQGDDPVREEPPQGGGDIFVTTPCPGGQADGAAGPPDSGSAALDGQANPAREEPPQGGGDIFVTTYRQNCQGVVTKLSGGGDKNVQENSTSTIITEANITKAAAACRAETQKTPPPENAGAAAGKNIRTEKDAPPARPDTTANPDAAPGIQKLKAALSAVAAELVFDAAFYPRALAFMAANGLGNGYLSWIHARCLEKKPRFLPGLFYRLFFADNMLELFNVSRPPPGPAARPPPVISPCPACGQPHDRSRDCPVCGLAAGAPPDQAEHWKRVYALPEDRRRDFLQRDAAILSSARLKDFKKTAAARADLRREFGVQRPEDPP